MRGLFFLATEKGFVTLSEIIENGYLYNIGCVVSFEEVDVEEIYYNKIKDICFKNSIPFFSWSDIKNSIEAIISEYNLKFAIAISWKYMLPLSINKKLKYDLIVFHDSLLPKYRGFAPTPTAIICGDTTLGVTAIFAEIGVDEGNIVLQREYKINEYEYIKDIISKQSKIFAEMMMELIDRINSDNLYSTPQNNEIATYSIWRSIEDCKIDWEKDAKEIYNFVRALGIPYKGAYTIVNGEKIIIRKVSIEKDLKFELRDAGKIWRIEGGCPIIICGNGMIKIIHAENEVGKVYQFNKVRMKLL